MAGSDVRHFGRVKKALSEEESSDVAGIALLASAIGNLWQASKRADLVKDRDYLLSVLRQWQVEHSRLATRVASLSKAYEGLEGVARTLREEVEELKQEKQEWQTKYYEAQKKFTKTSLKSSPESSGKRS